MFWMVHNVIKYLYINVKLVFGCHEYIFCVSGGFQSQGEIWTQQIQVSLNTCFNFL